MKDEIYVCEKTLNFKTSIWNYEIEELEDLKKFVGKRNLDNPRFIPNLLRPFGEYKFITMKFIVHENDDFIERGDKDEK